MFGMLLTWPLSPVAAQNKRGNCSINKSNDLWFFGQGIYTVPGTFTQGDVKTVLSLRHAGPGPYYWNIVSGDDKASLNQSSYLPATFTDGTSVTLYSIYYSTKRYDVTVQATDSANNTAQILLTVDSPYQLTGGISIKPRGVADCTGAKGNNGWYAQYTWHEASFLNNKIYGQDVNEYFTNQTRVYPGENLSFTPNGWPGVANVENFHDTYCDANQIAAVPKPTTPQKPLGSVVIDDATQTYQIGTQIVGSGVEAQSQILIRYVDHPSVTNIVSPVR
jgi:hypothetical protein